MTRLLPPPSPHHRRRGFTLIEVLVVITILAILAAFLVPALSGASLRARIVQVKADISAIEGAIAQFKTQFDMEPPSSIILFESPTDWTTPPSGATAGDVARSRALIRQMWPQYDFSVTHDINNDGDSTDRIYLGGAECLVFFLGGVPQWSDNNSNGKRDIGEVATIGFSKNPTDPFRADGNRLGPFFDFVTSRFCLSPNEPFPNTSTGPFNNAGFLAYRDTVPSQSLPYVYLSSYGGKGYRASDGIKVPNSVTPNDPPSSGSNWVNGISAVYSQGTATTSPAWNATKYQIISPGFDKEYGTGGAFSVKDSSTLLTGARSAQQDNICNFHTGRLSDK